MLNKKILLGVTGGIAAYKSAELVRLLRKAGCEVRVVMTKSAQQFITSLTMSVLSENTVYTDLFDQKLETKMGHISLSRWADVVLIAPATANFMAQLAHGFCDDLLSTLCLATPKATAIAIAPAMNKEMWQAESTQKNLNILKEREVLILGPDEGVQACGECGIGRMLEPTAIMKYLTSYFTSDILSGRRILITAGPTLEPLDPVRYISNFSSGKMGYAIAESMSDVGASVTLISGPTNLLPPSNVTLIKVTTAREMLAAVMKDIGQYDMFISVAAVLDYCPASFSSQKIKKSNKSFRLDLELNPDILAAVASLSDPPITIGFAAETEDVIENALQKLRRKNVDMIIANKVGDNLGFNKDENHLFILRKGIQEVHELKPASKTTLAKQLIPIFEDLWVTCTA